MMSELIEETHPETILVVDDEMVIRDLCRHMFESAGYRCHTAKSVAEAKEILQKETISVVLTDLRMPEQSGIVLLKYIQANWPYTATIVVTGVSEISVAVEAIHLGAYDYICKPFRAAELSLKIRIALEKRRLIIENQSYHEQLEQKVQEQTQEIRRLYDLEKQRTSELESALQAVQKAHFQAQEALIAALGLRDCETRGHCRRVMRFAGLLAERLGLSPEEVIHVERGALLHDIGKIGIPDSILYKPGPLTDEEWDLMRKHPIQGAAMLAGIEFLKPAFPIVLSHHERYDGSGYPYGLKGTEIPIGARIFAIADALDVITTERPYKTAASFEEAAKEIKRCAGSHFDPQLVDVFLSVPIEEWQRIQTQTERELAHAEECHISPGLIS